jgi:hypothetical protein
MQVIFIVVRKENNQVESLSANRGEVVQGRMNEQYDRKFAALDLLDGSRL